MKRPYGYWQQSASALAILHDPSDADDRGYITIGRGGKTLLLHRWLWEQLVGPIPHGHEIDHINGLRHDCRIANLRCVQKIANMRNRAKPRNNTSGTTGASRVVIKGTEYWVTTWKDPNQNKQRYKYFNVKKLGEGAAKAAALAHRATVLSDLQLNHGYTSRHGL